MVQIPTIFVDGDTVTAAQLNRNFAVLAAKAIRNGDVSVDAGIDRQKLAQRYNPQTIFLTGIDVGADADLGTGGNAPATFTGLDTSFVEIHRYFFRVPSSGSLWLTALDVFVRQVVNTAELRFSIDSIIIGGSAIAVSSNLKYSVARPQPFENPMVPISDGSAFIVEVRDTAAGAAEIRGVDISIHLKSELTS
ncbi:MAG: hypothetical protein HC882_01430 [Acidobacteria bacterium]|nr:hypothetical protein [Acidobacteriota bacterium]